MARAEIDPSFPVILGLGANLGDTVGTLRRSVVRLGERFGRAAEFVAGLYRSAPVGPAQPDFYNSAVLFRSPLGPAAILAIIRAVEGEFGRIRHERWGPRTLDIDVLWAGWSSELAELRVPHPELAGRAFAMLPLMELWEALADPSFALPAELFFADRIEGRSRQSIERVSGPEWVLGP